MSLGLSARNQILAGTALVTVFVAGGLGGAAIERVRSSAEPATADARQQRRDDCPSVRDPNRPRRTPYDDLGLTEAQKARVDSVLHSQGAEMSAQSRDSRARMDSIVVGTREAIRTILTPTQQAEMERRRAAWAARDSVRREERRIRCAALQDSSRSRQDSGAAAR